MGEERPNLFDYATSELSQDAFLCWLLSWADHSYAKVDSTLHQTAIEFLRSIGSKFEIDAFDGAPALQVEVLRQHYGIDILALISVGINKYALVIEDKINSTMQNEQLARYRKTAQEQFSDHQQLRIYLKTGEVSHAAKAKEDGYAVYSRTDLLNVLGGNVKKTEDSILRDYYQHWRLIDDEYQEFRTKPIDEWINHWRAWEGFFGALQKEMSPKKDCWQFVNNQSGGEYIFDFSWRDVAVFGKDFDIGLVIVKKFNNNEGAKGRCFLSFKVGSVSKENGRARVRNKLHHSLMESVRNHEKWGGKVSKPQRFGNGDWMVFGEVTDQNNWLAKDTDGTLDIAETIKKLNQAKELLKIVSDNNQ